MTSKKRTDSVITQDDLEEFIKTQDDFALELFTYSLARFRGYHAVHAGSYIDPVSGKSRQFDVRASRRSDSNINVFLAVESKSLRPNFPLLVSRIPRLPSESFQDVMHSGGVKVYDSTRTTISMHVFRLDGTKSLYPPNMYVGKSLVQVGYNDAGGFRSNDYEVFEKWGQAISSVNDLIRQASILRGDTGEPQRSVVLPVLVVPDGMLWAADYAETGVVQEGPHQVDEVQFFIGSRQEYAPNPDYRFTISHLHIVTKIGYEKLLCALLDGGDALSHIRSSL